MARKSSAKRQPRVRLTPGALAALVASSPARGFAALALLVLGSLVGVAVGREPLMDRVAQARADPVVLRFQWPRLAARGAADTWLPRSERRRLEQIALGAVSVDPFDHASLERARAALVRTGWFLEGPTVRRRPRGVVQITGVWRTPSAVVRDRAVERLVDREGALLPIEYPKGQAGDLRVIVNAWAPAPRYEHGALAFGEPWLGGDVQSAIALLEFVSTSAVSPHIQGVDLKGAIDTGRLTLLIHGGGRIEWGARPGASAPGEQPDSVKLKRLEELLADPQWTRAGAPRASVHTPYVFIDESPSPR